MKHKISCPFQEYSLPETNGNSILLLQMMGFPGNRNLQNFQGVICRGELLVSGSVLARIYIKKFRGHWFREQTQDGCWALGFETHHIKKSLLAIAVIHTVDGRNPAPLNMLVTPLHYRDPTTPGGCLGFLNHSTVGVPRIQVLHNHDL